VPLLAEEELVLMYGIKPTTTLTWFHGNHLEAAIILRKRMADIVLQNP
jgi:hypothetical protein